MEAKRPLEEDHEVECQANAAYKSYRARGMMKDGRRFGCPPNPHQPPAMPAGQINVTDPDSRNVRDAPGSTQGYNGQAVSTRTADRQCLRVTVHSSDVGHLEPWGQLTAACRPSR
jgi:hypothetical protein